jgi:flagellar biosynthesis/type III secretory pathway protein FliH
MREILLFAAGASLAATIFLVAVLELIFTIKRRKLHEQLDAKVKEMKASYNQQVNQLVMEEEQKLQAADEHVETVTTQAEEEKKQVETEFTQRMQKLEEETEKALAKAKEHAKKMEQEAKLKAEEYLESRKDEVEQELMNLVMSVTKKVLPQSLTYEIQKELVIAALKEAKLGSGHGHD